MIRPHERSATRRPAATRPRRVGLASCGALALALAVALTVTGCGGPAPDPTDPLAAPSASALPEGVTVELVQGRSDVAARQAAVRVTNGTGDPLVVGAVRVDDPRFDGPAVRVVDRESRIGAGTTAGIRVQLPAVACADTKDAAKDATAEDGDAGAGAEASVTLEYSTGGDPVEVTVPIADPLGFVGPLHERECRVERLAQAATVAFTDFTPSPPGVPASLELTVTPTGKAAGAIREIQTTNLLTFARSAANSGDTHTIDVEVTDADTEPVVVSLPLLPYRCDAHAVQEDKRGTIFDVVVEFGGEEGEIELAASEELRGRILKWVGEWCGFGG